MPAPLMAGLMYVLSAVAGWMIQHGIRAAITAAFGFMAYKSDFGHAIVYKWANSAGWGDSVNWLLMPNIPGNWTEWLNAANAWVALAEAWRIVKLYYSMKVSSIGVSLAWRFFSK